MAGLKERAVRVTIAGVVAISASITGLGIWVRVNPSPKIVVGYVPLDEPVAIADEFPPHREPPPPPPPRRSRGGGGVPRFSNPGVRGLWPPNGTPPGPERPYTGSVDDSGGLQFVLILGSDVRSGDPIQGRSDSIHVLALDPKARRGTVMGIPRDSYVDIPGEGRQKINEALRRGGPELAVRTVRNLTGMPITYYVVAAFDGFRTMVDALGGLDGFVPYDMNDSASGAFFQTGWHRMDGGKALAFSRNRHIPAGDFARSENQGRLMIDGLKKLRAETGNQSDVEGWVRILARHTRVNMSFGELVRLAVLARVTAASNVRNLVTPGRTGSAGGASVVFLTDQAYEMFRDVGQEAIANGSYPAYGPPHPHDQGEAPPPPEPSPEPVPTPPLP